jgi:pilus assembly protein CpaB
MNRVRILTVLVVALLAGGGLAAGTYNYLQNAVPAKTVTVPTKPVVMANADLSLGNELRADDLKIADWPASSVPEGAFAQKSELVGRSLIASVVRNEPILASKLAAKEAGTGLPPVIPKGKRAVSVKVNEVIGVAGYVLPGSFVDVVTTANPTGRPEDVTSKVVLTNVQALAAGTRLEQDQKDGKPMQVTVVTLLVTPEESERLALSSAEGKIQLALRNPLDETKPETPGIGPAVLLGRGKAPRGRAAATRPSAPPSQNVQPAPQPTVEIIRGDKRERAVVGQE